MVASAPHALVIVESPTKAKKIQQYLGSGFRVEACVGHIRDLPAKASELPANKRETAWAKTGVNVSAGFAPIYVVPKNQQTRVKELQQALASANSLFLATDGDREGEAIAWHLQEVLKPTVPVHRLVFHEVTRKAIQEGMQHTRKIDMSLVDAQETRRILDRLVGYEVSPLLWKKVAKHLSAGRVQSVAVRLLVERERERMAFNSANWWDLKAHFCDPASTSTGFTATLIAVDGRRLVSGSDFDSTTGQLAKAGLVHLSAADAVHLREQLATASFSVTDRQDKPYRAVPKPPFTTSTLQQEASRKLSWSSKKTMQVAQRLYENGHITYMRTDSTNLSDEAVAGIRTLVSQRYGKENLPSAPPVYQTKTANAQEAHEAIRPADTSMPDAESLGKELTTDGIKLYDLIWKRTVASQMADTRGQSTTLTLSSSTPGGPATEFRATGRIIDFLGHQQAYTEGSDDTDENVPKDTALPSIEIGTAVACSDLEANQHTTKPKPRYTDSSLIKTLEERGIGRPSTYASAIETIRERNYCIAKDKTLIPTWIGFAVTQLLEEGLPPIVDYDFTAHLEADLDEISNGRKKRTEFLNEFYFGGTQPGLSKLLEDALKNIDPRNVSTVSLPCGIDVHVGKYGPYVELDNRRYTLPQESFVAPADVTEETLAQLRAGDEPLGLCPKTNLPIFLKSGRYGTYVTRGTKDDHDHKSGSLLKGMKPESVTLEIAIVLLELPKLLGKHPQTSEPVLLHNGRFGLYVQSGKETRSIPNELSSLNISLDAAITLLAEPKSNSRTQTAVIRSLGESPTTGQPVVLKEGKYGPFVTDGKTNATLPKGTDPATITLETALGLIATRPAKKRRPRRRS